MDPTTQSHLSFRNTPATPDRMPNKEIALSSTDLWDIQSKMDETVMWLFPEIIGRPTTILS